MTLAEYKARPPYDPVAAYADFVANPDKYCLVSDLIREVMPGIVKNAAMKDLQACRTMDELRRCFVRWREKMVGEDVEFLTEAAKKFATKLEPKKEK